MVGSARRRSATVSAIEYLYDPARRTSSGLLALKERVIMTGPPKCLHLGMPVERLDMLKEAQIGLGRREDLYPRRSGTVKS